MIKAVDKKIAFVCIYNAQNIQYNVNTIEMEGKMANLTVRIDEKLKADAESVLSKLGLTASDAIRIFFSQIRNTKGIPFELKLYDDPSAETVAAIKQAEKDLKAGKVSRPYDDVDALMTDLLKE